MKNGIFCLWLLIASFNCFSNDLLEKGISAIENSDFKKANQLLTQFIDRCENCPDSSLAKANIYKGKANQLLEKYDFAYSSYRKGLSIYRNSNDANGQVFALVSIAEFYRNLAQFEKSLNYLNQANFLIETDSVSIRNEIYYLNRYAAIHNEMGDELETIISYSERVILLARKLGDKDLEANSLNELGFIYEKKRDIKALDYYNLAYTIYEGLGNKLNMAYVIRNLARMTYMLEEIENNHQKALKIANNGLKLVDTTNWISIKVSLYHTKYQSLIGLKQFEEAAHVALKLQDVRIKELELEKSKELFETEVKFSLKEKDNIILLEQKKRELLNEEIKSNSSKFNYFLIFSLLLALLLVTTYIFFYRTKKNNQKLQKSVSQKEALLQEVHHRVKNNLTILNSLLYLQSKSIEDKRLQIILSECQARVNSMALVHQNLYNVEDVTEVNLDKFISELVSDSARIFNQEDFHLKVNNNNVSYNMGRTIFIGLILNELITNSFKYAFSIEKDNSINITIDKNDSINTISYQDSGEGLNVQFDEEKKGGFGFRLIKIMLNQIEAKIEYSKSENTFLIKFKDDKKV
tara:strand:- start:11570 stop:13306 length:1737 start_codon:yes stop_codon:yes gene_type:complete